MCLAKAVFMDFSEATEAEPQVALSQDEAFVSGNLQMIPISWSAFFFFTE